VAAIDRTVIINRLGGDWLRTLPEEGAALRHLSDWAPVGRTPSVLGTHESSSPIRIALAFLPVVPGFNTTDVAERMQTGLLHRDS
jgi:hypothetical protein